MLSVEKILSTFRLLFRSSIQLSTACEIEWLLIAFAIGRTGASNFFLTTRIARGLEFFICLDVGMTELNEILRVVRMPSKSPLKP